MTDIFAVVNTALLVLNFGLVIYGVSLTLKHYRYNRTWSYIERYNSNDMLKPKVAANLLMKEIDGLACEDAVAQMSSLLSSNDPMDIEKYVQIDTYINLLRNSALPTAQAP